MKRFQIHLWLVLALIAFTAVPSHAQLVFQFEQFGSNTVITGSGGPTLSTTATGTQTSVGFYSVPTTFGPGALFIDPYIPMGWVSGNIPGPGLGGAFSSSTLMINTIPLTSVYYNNRPGNESLYFNTVGLTPIPSSTLVSASGTATIADPYSFLFSNHAPGTVLVIIPGVLHYVIGIGPVVVEPITTAGGRTVVSSYRTTNIGAIISANSSLFWGFAMQSANRTIVDTAVRDLRGEVFADGFEAGDTNAWTSSDAGSSSSLLRYFAFMQDENMSYKVALGLADPEERTIEVNMADTLSAQIGSNFNGQTLGGGLPYAMMGVPMMPMAGGAATVHVVEAAASGKTVIEDAKSVIEADPTSRYRIFASGDFSNYDQDQLSDLMEGFDTETYAGSIGFDYRINEWLKAGLAWSYAESDTNASGNIGNLDLEGNLISAFATAYWRRNWFDLIYSYGSFENDLRRNTGLGSTARGNTDSDSNNVRLNMGHNINIGNNVVTGPVAGLRYGAGDIDPYSETGGGLANMNQNGSDFESMVSRLGWQASHVRPTGWGRIVSQVRVAWEHEYLPENGTVSGSLATSPFALVTGGSARSIGGYSTSSDGDHPGTDWMAAGAGFRFDLTQGLAVHADYEGAFFRSNASQHYGSLKVSYEW